MIFPIYLPPFTPSYLLQQLLRIFTSLWILSTFMLQGLPGLLSVIFTMFSQEKDF